MVGSQQEELRSVLLLNERNPLIYPSVHTRLPVQGLIFMARILFPIPFRVK
jgi:hypothetical protein